MVSHFEHHQLYKDKGITRSERNNAGIHIAFLFFVLLILILSDHGLDASELTTNAQFPTIEEILIVLDNEIITNPIADMIEGHNSYVSSYEPESEQPHDPVTLSLNGDAFTIQVDLLNRFGNVNWGVLATAAANPDSRARYFAEGKIDEHLLHWFIHVHALSDGDLSQKVAQAR